MIGYTFQKRELLQKALTHASKSPIHLERQEFLGDAVLGLTIAEYLYQFYPDSPEGILSKMRANLVCKQALLVIASDWKLAHYLNVGDGERNKKGLLKSESIAANAVEAVIGAVFEDGGWDKAKTLVLHAWKNSLENIKPINLSDAKSQLQEQTQAFALGLPLYQINDFGVQQTPRFQAKCFLNDQMIGEGFGQRKKEAELKAAQQALESEIIQQLKD